ncbi:MAG: DNA primase [Ezakiella sp.]|nr:DNA primase [Ezakiella sp.]MDD7471988.1 DNA primase [Bacillota bacterium]MDY3923952.1 DNA primase [Ezakiella sp.]
MYIGEDKLEQIKDSIDIVDLIGSYIPLTRRGKNYLGLCPFHKEKTPSFTVNPDGKFFKCFGCGAGGDAFTFLEMYEGMDFNQAVKFLAEKYHIVLNENSTPNTQISQNAVIYDINRDAALYFMENIKDSRKAQDYLEKRKISKNSIVRFGIGFAKDSWDDMIKHMKSLGYKEEDLVRANLIQKSEKTGNYFDLFRSRLIFPIIDLKSRVVGFSGRIIGQGEPKYYNSRESEVFKKGNILFGLNLVKNNKNRDKILLVEGNIDVVKLHQMGINYAVAPLGTAFTERQATLLKRFGREVYLCLDGDFAGQKATHRDIEILRNIGITPKILKIPDNLDPDEFIDKFGVDEFQFLMDRAMSVFDFEQFFLKSDLDIDKREEFIKYIERLINFIKLSPSPVEREIYIKEISIKYNIEISTLTKELEEQKRAETLKNSEINYTIPKASNKFIKILFEMMLIDKVFTIEAENANIKEYLPNLSLQKLLDRIFLEYETKEKIDVEEFLNTLINENEIDSAVLRSFVRVGFYQDYDLNYFNDVINGVKRDFIAQKRFELNKKIKEASEDGQNELVVSLLQELDALQKMEGEML